MVRKAIDNITKKMSSLHQAAFWLSFFAFLSQILALCRDRLLAHIFGISNDLDIYYSAFRIPDVIFFTVASLVSISVLVPVFAKKESEGERHLKEATSSIFTVFTIVIFLISTIIFLLMPYLIKIFFNSFSLFDQNKIVYLSRLLLLSPIFLGFSNFFGSIVQYQKRFILYSISPILYNIGIIFGIVFLTDHFGISGVAIGVAVGALLHLLLQAIFILVFSNIKFNFIFKINWGEIFDIIKLSLPRTLAISIFSLVSFYFVVLASKLNEGAVSIFNFSYNLQSVPLSLIGVSFAIAAFPALSISFVKKDFDEIIIKISESLRQIIFWSIPFVSLLIILRAHIVRVILGSGSFDWMATKLVAASLALFVASSIFQSINLFLSRAHYALGKTTWPFISNLIGGFFAIITAMFFLNYDFGDYILNGIARFLDVSDFDYGVLILPLAFSFGTFITTIFIFFSLGKSLYKYILKNIWISILKIILGGFLMSSVIYLTIPYLNGFFGLDKFLGVFLSGLSAGIFGIVSFVLLMYLLKCSELYLIFTKFKK